jgi:hypothetical protein
MATMVNEGQSGEFIYACRRPRSVSIALGAERSKANVLVAARIEFHKRRKVILCESGNVFFSLELESSETALWGIPVAYDGKIVTTNREHGQVTVQSQMHKSVIICVFGGSRVFVKRRLRPLGAPFDVFLHRENDEALPVAELYSESLSLVDLWKSRFGIGHGTLGRCLYGYNPQSKLQLSLYITVLSCLVVFDMIFRREFCNSAPSP